MINRLFESQMSIAEFYENNRETIGEEVIILDSPQKNKLARFSYIFFNIKSKTELPPRITAKFSAIFSLFISFLCNSVKKLTPM